MASLHLYKAIWGSETPIAKPLVTRCTAKASPVLYKPCLPALRPTVTQQTIRKRSARLSRTITASAAAPALPQDAEAKPLWPRVQKFLFDQFVPLGLVTAILIGTFFPEPGAHAAKYGVLRIATTGIFFIQGLNLRGTDVAKALSAWGAVLYGLTSILLVTPLFGMAVLKAPLQPAELAFGLAVFSCMPTTLSSGVSLTSQCEGNTALALLLTVGSNLLGVFTMPFVLLGVIGAATSNLSLSPTQLLGSLVQCILLPLLVGAACRALIPGLAGWVDRNKKGLQLANGTLLCSTPWTQVSTAVLQGTTLAAPSLLALVGCCIALHTAMFAFNATMVKVLKIGGDTYEARHIRRAVILCASQKTLPVAVTILHKLSGCLGGAVGLAVIPCVIGHMLQIVMDSLVVSRWLRADAQYAAAEQAKAALAAAGATEAPHTTESALISNGHTQTDGQTDRQTEQHSIGSRNAAADSGVTPSTIVPSAA